MDEKKSIVPDARVNDERRWSARGVAALAVVWGAACTPTIDPASLSGSIKSKLEAQGVTVNSVTCPSGKAMKKDDTFTCQGVSGKGDAFTVTVTQTDGVGNTNVELEGKVFDPAAFADSALKHFTNNRKVDCGKEKFIAVKGTEMACAVEGGKSATVTFGDGGKLGEDQVQRIIGGQ